MSLKDAAARAAMLAALHSAVGDELAAAKKEVDAGLKAAKKESGTTQIAAELPDGTRVAKVTLVSPDPAATVTDDKAFLAWVREVHPQQIHSRLVVEHRARKLGLGLHLNALAVAAAHELGAAAMIGTSGTADGQDRFHARFGFHPVPGTRRPLPVGWVSP